MEMINLLSAFTLPHIVAGTFALAAFWLAALVRKGRYLHRLAGRTHLLAMLAVIVTAIPLTLATYLNGHVIGAAFLGYLVILVSQNCLVGWRAIHYKRDFALFNNRVFRVGLVVNALAGMAIVVLGLYAGSMVLIAFGAIGPLSAIDPIREMRAGQTRAANWWLRQHLNAMLGNGVAVHIAFTQIGLGRILRSLDSTVIFNLAWFLPLAVGVMAGTWLSRKYLKSAKAAV
jgi:hypothetical protein